MKKIFLALTLVLLITSCANKPVNPARMDAPTIMLGSPTPGDIHNAGIDQGRATGQTPSPTAQIIEENMRTPSDPSISGRVVLKSEIPVRVSRLPINLYQEEKGKWVLKSNQTTDTDGSFRFTLKLWNGNYRLEIPKENKSYAGQMELTLQNKPATDVIFEVIAKAKK